ncbi:MAG: enoyl-CoA hydratase/isomerase family protein [SAR202 cluster bacterium]|nr:enoyl-CoA hydratase/isomerase family protein [SAR202 cluster bacterium]
MNQDASVVQYSTKGAIALISLNRPKQINAFNVQMRDELYEILSLFQKDDSVKVAIIKGNGPKGFCAGADLSEFGSAPSQIIAREVRWQRDLWGLFLKMQKPIIAQLHGFVIGSGIEIASFCDLRVATESAKFKMPESSLGLIPAAGGTQTLPRSIGTANSLKMLLTNFQVDAKTAKTIGLIDRIVDDEKLEQEVFLIARQMCNMQTNLVGSVKKLIRNALDHDISNGIVEEKFQSKKFLLS